MRLDEADGVPNRRWGYTGAMLGRTSTTLLNSLIEEPADQRAWRTFCERYGPAIYRFARRRGLSEADAEEVLSATLTAFFEAYRAGRYDRSRGRFRTWLFGIAMNKVHETRRAYGRAFPTSKDMGHPAYGRPSPTSKDRGHPAMGHLEDGMGRQDELAEEPGDPEFEVDVERTLAWQCLDAVRTRVAPLTYQAFDLYVLKGRTPKDVAKTLGIDTSAVYVAKSRVLSYARREFEQLQSQIDEV